MEDYKSCLWVFILICALNIVPSTSEIKIKCPTKIKVFAAYPFSDYSKRNFYYECDEEKEAVLKSCKNGEIYFPELEACDVSEDVKVMNDVNRFKRDTANQAGKQKQKVKQKRLGRNVRLGALYYGQTDDVHVDEHLWDIDSLNGTFKTSTPYKHGWARISQSTMQRINNFDIDARLGVSFAGGLVEVSGTARYLSEKRKSTNSVVVSYFYEVVTSSESITQRIANQLTYPHLCNLVGTKNGPTHVITSVTKGQTAIFDFQLEAKDEKDISEIGGSLKVAIKNLPSIKIEAEAKLKITQEETIKQKDLTCSFKSDFDFNDNPTNFQEAVETYKQLNNLTLENVDNILSFEAQPIEKYCGGKEAILNLISSKIITNIGDVLQELEDTRLLAESLKNNRAAMAYRNSLGKVISEFLTKLNDYKTDWEINLKKTLPLVRGGSNAELDLISSLNEYANSPFEYNRALNFLLQRKKELKTVELALQQTVKGIIIDEASSVSVQECEWHSPFAAVYELNVLPENNVVNEYIDAVKHSQNWTEPSKWFEDLQGFGRASNLYRDFIDFRKINMDRNDVCFIVKLDYNRPGKNYASIKILENGVELQNNFHLENRPEIPTSHSIQSSIHHIISPIKVTYTSVWFDVAWHPDNLITKQVAVTTNKLVDVNSTGVTQFHPLNRQGPTRITVNRLQPNTAYQITYSLASGKPHNLKTSESNNIMVTTNPFSTPTNVRISEVTDSSFLISYKRPHTIAPNVTIDAYEIDVYDENGRNTMPTIIQPSNNNSQAIYRTIIDNLDFSTIYNVKISAKSNAQPREETHVSRQQFFAETKAITLPTRLETPNVISTSHHTMSIRWNPPTRIAPDAYISNYVILYERIDPHSLESLSVAKTQFSGSNEITLQGLAAGATYKVQVKIRTTEGESEYSAEKIASTPMVQTEFEELRHSLNLPTLEQKIRTIESKPRFAAQILDDRTYYLPRGYIKKFTESIDVNNNFDPTTGVFTVSNDGDAGVYVFQVSGRKEGTHPRCGPMDPGCDPNDPFVPGPMVAINVEKNNDFMLQIQETKTDRRTMINSLFTLSLKKGDKVRLWNVKHQSVQHGRGSPFTFTGHKI